MECPKDLEPEYGKEIDFRTQLESHLHNKENEKIPTVLMVINGGKNTLKTILNALKEKIPVLLLKVYLIK